MRYVTHHFANVETLERARRWLVQLGFDQAFIETHTEGTPRLALAIKPDEWPEVEAVINAAEMSDPQGWPSFWDLAQQTHVVHEEAAQEDVREFRQSHATAIGWHPEERTLVADAAPVLGDGPGVITNFT
jgi:hypothetical protein